MPDLDNLTCCVDSLHIWFCGNGMALNPDKSDAILLGTRQTPKSPEPPHPCCYLFSSIMQSTYSPAAAPLTFYQQLTFLF